MAVSNQSITQKRQKLKSIDELSGLESQQEASRKLQRPVDMPCIARYFSGEVFPEVGNRGNRFYGLVANLRRLGMTEAEARQKMLNYFNKIPPEIILTGGLDGQPFSQAELERIIKSTYRSKDNKPYLCRSGFWQSTCIGPDMCQFYKLHTQKQDRESIYYDFLFLWLGAKDQNGKKRLNEIEIRVYLAVDAIEKYRGYKPGSNLFTSWSEIGRYSGVSVRKVGPALEGLFWNNLIAYKKGTAQTRGTASEIRRVIPIPLPYDQKT